MLDFGFYNMDCMDGMKEFPDKYFDLAIVDPPYGIDINKSGRLKKYNDTRKKWDDNIPEQDYFDELFRISKNQIIWGGNYFYLPPFFQHTSLRETANGHIEKRSRRLKSGRNFRRVHFFYRPLAYRKGGGKNLSAAVPWPKV